ncbi:transmembrane protein, putative (macronuclear) [Tetrahymena thermophila SB210]|uniref:Transmembrane protein, putative n=1 Tax=Tetrahymena thermophila (strain SB210) TaxID=312017 RepID=W7XIX3_TETTS|nr:transmembrane protein, putative [Tetrahymena thermophila SB210]EWS73674.1 transmembrane protein, putative [Tetrahymena thermophila SB210]|eukprot:XP_012653804.1 transmembrane protein, putative [Tetrahymena thermophila SB210]
MEIQDKIIILINLVLSLMYLILICLILIPLFQLKQQALFLFLTQQLLNLMSNNQVYLLMLVLGNVNKEKFYKIYKNIKYAILVNKVIIVQKILTKMKIYSVQNVLLVLKIVIQMQSNYKMDIGVRVRTQTKFINALILKIAFLKILQINSDVQKDILGLYVNPVIVMELFGEKYMVKIITVFNVKNVFNKIKFIQLLFCAYQWLCFVAIQSFKFIGSQHSYKKK